MNIQELAKIMGQKESDVIAFVECLKVWTDKEFTVEQAIEKHMSQMNRFINHSDELPKSIIVDAFYSA